MDAPQRVSTGVPGLDLVLQGGFIPGRGYLMRGGPGTGKTTFGLHFLARGAVDGEPSLFVTLSESESQIRTNGELLGFDLSDVHFLDLSPSSDAFVEEESYDIFSPAEVEGKPTRERIAAAVEELAPTRVFIDSMTQFRHLAADAYQFRKQVLAFLRYLLDRGVTVVFTSEAVDDATDEDLRFMADGVLHLIANSSERILNVDKFRASGFKPGRHAVRLSDRGMQVFPRLIPEEYKQVVELKPLPMGIPELDQLLGGGLERGTVTIVTGPSGVGKTSIAMQFAKEAAGRGERTAVYLFEESQEVLLERCESISIPVHRMVEDGRLGIEYVEPLKYPPNEFAARVRREVEEMGAKIVVLDSIAGYRLALTGSDVAPSLHALCKYLTNMGVAVVITNEVEKITGDFKATEAGISFLADNIVYLRYFEAQGSLRKAIGVLKKRLSTFEKSLRELRITQYGIMVGDPLSGLRGILSGTPRITDGESWAEKLG